MMKLYDSLQSRPSHCEATCLASNILVLLVLF